MSARENGSSPKKTQKRIAIGSLTSRQPVPHLQPVVLAVPVSARQGVVLQVEGEEAEGHVHAGRDDDDEGALQVVWVLVGEARGLDDARRTGEVTGTV